MLRVLQIFTVKSPQKIHKHSPTGGLVCTIGHSNRPLSAFLDLLAINEIDCVVDVRTVPRSRHNPQFNQDTLPHSLAAAGIRYRYLPGLGGLRHAARDSINTGWRNASFRGYADYMQSLEFDESMELLVELAAKERCVLMCAEAVPWRCHRSMIGDALPRRTAASPIPLPRPRLRIQSEFAQRRRFSRGTPTCHQVQRA